MRVRYLSELVAISLILVAMVIATVLKRKKFLEKTASSLFNVLLSMIIPLAGNFLALFTDLDYIAEAGYTLMHLGDCFLLYNLMIFITDYCGFKYRRSPIQIITIVLLSIVSLSIFVNPFFHHMFTTSVYTLSDGATYFGTVPGWAKLLCFCLLESYLVLMIGILIDKCLKISSAYHERYFVIIFAIIAYMVFFFATFSNRPVNYSLIGYIICGFLLFLFTFIYKPIFIRRKLADSVVGNHIDGIIFYDTDVNALYANDRAYEILHIESGNPNKCTDKLIEVMGGGDLGVDFDISTQFKDSEDGDYTYIRITHRLMKDKRDLEVGSFFSIHDNTEQVNQDKERQYLATHDVLTGLSNRISFEE